MEYGDALGLSDQVKLDTQLDVVCLVISDPEVVKCCVVRWKWDSIEVKGVFLNVLLIMAMNIAEDYHILCRI